MEHRQPRPARTVTLWDRWPDEEDELGRSVEERLAAAVAVLRRNYGFDVTVLPPDMLGAHNDAPIFAETVPSGTLL